MQQRLVHSTMSSNTASGTCPTFCIQHRDGKARSGVVTTRHGEIRTPASLLYTRRGNPLNLTPDLVAKLKPLPQGFQLDVLQFLASPTPDTLNKHSQGAHGYLALHPGIPVVGSQRDPTMYEYGNKPSTDQGVYATIHTGGVLVTPEAYMTACKALQPDLWVTLGDEIPSDSKPKRVKTSVDRSTKWLDACLAAASASPPDVDSNGPTTPQPTLADSALALVGGAGLPQERERAAKAVANKPVAGFALAGFGTGESRQERSALLQACVQHLPEHKPRFLSGMAHPVEVLEAVAEGVDILDDAYVIQAATSGYALSFPLSPAANPPSQQPDPDQGTDHTKINLWSQSYRHDKSPVLPGCQCYTCSRHTRSYIHHLLQTNEMLAEVLLELHNTHHYQLFMGHVRESIQAGKFQEYVAWFKGLKGHAVRVEKPVTEQGNGGGKDGVRQEVMQLMRQQPRDRRPRKPMLEVMLDCPGAGEATPAAARQLSEQGPRQVSASSGAGTAAGPAEVQGQAAGTAV